DGAWPSLTVTRASARSGRATPPESVRSQQAERQQCERRGLGYPGRTLIGGESIDEDLLVPVVHRRARRARAARDRGGVASHPDVRLQHVVSIESGRREDGVDLREYDGVRSVI